MQKIGAIIGVSDDNELFRLRTALVEAAEMIATFPDFFGGINSKSAKQQWIRQTSASVSGLLRQLRGADDYLPETLSNPGFRHSLAAVLRDLEKIQTVISTMPEDAPAGPTATLHSDYLQFTVDRLTEVFAQFRPASEIKRSYSDGAYGMFPDFIRAAGRPYLMVNHERFRLSPTRYEKLDRQIQNAIARSKGNYEQYHRKK